METTGDDQKLEPGYLLTLSWYPMSGVGGVNQAVMNLVRVMRDYDRWQPYVLVTSQTEIPANHPHLSCPVESMYLRAPDLPSNALFRSLVSFLWHLPGTMRDLNRLLTAKNVGLVNCHFPETESVHFILLRLFGIYRGKVILSFHGEDIRILQRKGESGRFVARWMMRHADRVVACSQGLLQDLVAFEPACAKRASVNYNAIDVDLYLRGIDRTFKLPILLDGRRFLLNVARYEHKKGHDILIRAFELLAEEFPDLMLVTIGTSVGAESVKVRALIDKSPVREKIIVLENLEHAKTGVFMEAASVFVLASRREGFPFVLLEAGAAQTPVVAAGCLGVPEIIEEGVTGRLTPMEDPVALANAAADLLRDAVTSGAVAQRLHFVVREKFSWKTAYEKHVSLAKT